MQVKEEFNNEDVACLLVTKERDWLQRDAGYTAWPFALQYHTKLVPVQNLENAVVKSRSSKSISHIAPAAVQKKIE